ncbi:MAG: hypothetical protein ABW321_11015, partial [Polyangiales bacterium]
VTTLLCLAQSGACGAEQSPSPMQLPAAGTAAGTFGTAGAATAAGAAAAPPGGDGFEAKVQPFIDKACNCHQSSPVLMAPFSLKRGEAYALMVNVPSMQLPGMLLVKPGSTAESYLWHKVNGTHLDVGGSGMIMPYTFPLNAEEKQIFERWIAGGALP